MFISLPSTILLFGILFQVPIRFIGFDPHVWWLLIVTIGLVLMYISSCDGHRAIRSHDASETPVLSLPWHVDGDWYHPWHEHALLQAAMIYIFLILMLLLVVDPPRVASLSFHQMLGDCAEHTRVFSLWETSADRPRYVCRYADFDDKPFNFCHVDQSMVTTKQR
jgi:hypothetical protein